jgi:hypothetical protein
VQTRCTPDHPAAFLICADTVARDWHRLLSVDSVGHRVDRWAFV